MNYHKRFLIPYPALKKDKRFIEAVEAGEDLPVEVFLDSGAFSVSTQGHAVDVYEYGRWLQDHHQYFVTYANLDVIGHGKESSEGTWRNQRILEDEFGLSPLPVFHSGEDWKVLERYLEAGYGYIGLGGLVGSAKKNLLPWLVQCFQMAEGSAVFHGFGQTTGTVLFSFPWFSADSSSWAAALYWGDWWLFDDRSLRWLKWESGVEPVFFEFVRLVRRYGMDFEKVIYPGGAADPRYAEWRASVSQVCGASYSALEAVLRKRFGIVTRPDGVAGTGMNIYLATSAFETCRTAAGIEQVTHV